MPCQTLGRVAEARVGRGAAEGTRPAARGPVLLLANHRVLEALGETELADALGRGLDGRARLGIAPDARFAVREHELAEAGQHELATLLRLLARECERLVEHALDLLLAGAARLRPRRARTGA